MSASDTPPKDGEEPTEPAGASEREPPAASLEPESAEKASEEARPKTIDTKRGLSAIRNARAARERASVQVGMVRGASVVADAALQMAGGKRVQVRRLPSLKVAGWVFLVAAVATVVFIYREAAAVEQDRQKLMADERNLDATLGKAWTPIRDAVEKLTVAAAGDPVDDVVEHEDLRTLQFQKEPGIYLRLRVDQAASPDAIRTGAEASLHDGFTTCLMETPGENSMGGAPCGTASDCAEGQMCNELDHCAKPTQPFNLRMAYRTMRILSPDWVKEVQDAGDRQRVHALRVTFDAAMKTDVPLAMELVGQAKFFLLVLDEKPAPPKEDADAGVSFDDQEALAGKHYASRVYVYRLSDQKLLLRMRRDEDVRAIGNPSSDPRAEAARLRQIRACGLAMDVKVAAH